MKKLLLALALLLTPASAFAQCSGVFPANTICGNNAGVPGIPTAIANSASGPGVPTNVLNTQTTNYTVTSTDCGKTIQAGTGTSGFFTIAIPSVSGFASNCVINITNGDTSRWKGISGLTGSGCSTRNVIGPGQTCNIGIVNGVWSILSRPGRYRPPSSTTINFNTDFTNGTDTLGAADGLATGAAAFKSAEYCFLFVADQIDYNSSSQTQVLCNMAAGTADTQGMHSPIHAMVGAQGGAAFQIVGASLAISGAVSHGGLCQITVPSTATYSNNQVVSVYGVGGATGCNGTWKITGISGTQLDLQNTTFGGSYTSGGTVTNGSSISVTGSDAVDCYFGTVIQFSNVTFSSNVNDLGLLWGCKVYLLSGNIFAGAPADAHISIQGPSKLEITNSYGIATSAANHVLTANMGQFGAGGATINIDMLPGVNHAFTVFAEALNVSVADFSRMTINTNSNTVTGTRCTAGTLGLVVSATGTANTYFPGNSNCTTNNGGVVD